MLSFWRITDNSRDLLKDKISPPREKMHVYQTLVAR